MTYGPIVEPYRWEFLARPLKGWAESVIDGDTLKGLKLDQGRRTYWEFSPDQKPVKNKGKDELRLLGVQCPESNRRASKIAGLAATAYTLAWLEAADGPEWPLRIETDYDDSLGRWLGVVRRVIDGRCLNDDLIEAGHATPFMV